MSEQGDVLEADTTVLLLNPRDSVWALEGKIFLNSGNGEIEFNDIQEGVSYRVESDEQTGYQEKVIIDSRSRKISSRRKTFLE